MDCGADDTLCQVLAWFFHDNEFATAVLTKWLGDTGVLGAVSAFLRDHGEKLIGLAGFSFGVYRWWKYREAMLHKRLDEYLRENDRRLVDGQTYVLQALQRPGPGQRFKLPLFASKALQAVLREHNWDRTFVAANVLSSADWQLSDAMGSIERKMQTAERTVSSLRQQLATAHILKGAIASAGADRSERATDSNSKALFSFRSALQIPGHEKDLTTRELEAHQLRKLQMYPQALAAYLEIEGLAAAIPSTRERDVLIARTKSCRAAILQAQASALQPSGERLFSGAAAANALLSPTVTGSALHMRASLKPFQDWDLLEEAETQYLAAFVAHNLNFPSMPQLRLNDAETAYNEILATRVRPWNRRARRELRRRAQAGLQRIVLARQSSPEFDWRWLCSP